MNDTEKIRIMHQGTENLIALGGFIQEEVENELSDLFSKKTSVAVEKYCGIGPGFWYVANETEKAFNQLNKYSETAILREEFSRRDRRAFSDVDTKFNQWVIDQTARCATDIFQSEGKRDWSNWTISRDIKRVLNELSPLEERILCLQFGLNGNKVHSVQGIAQLEEFKCPVEWVVRIEKYIEKRLNLCASGIKEFVSACERHHSNYPFESK